MPENPSRDTPVSAGGCGILWLLGAATWTLGFSVWFYGFGLPNNPAVSRPDFWLIVPDLLIDLADPPAAGDGSDWANVTSRGDIVLTAALIVLGAWGLGHLALAGVRPPLDDRSAEHSVLAFGCGISLLTLVTLGCGLAGWLTRPVLGGVVAVGILVGAALRARVWASGLASVCSRRKRRTGNAAGRLVAAVCLAAAGPFVLAMLLGATLPPTDFDAKAYHLVGPKEWFLDGRITFLPHNVYTSFPFLTEMLTLAGMVLRDDWYRGALVGQAVLMSFAPLTAVGLYAAGRRWFSPAAGWLAALVYLTTPWTYRISTIAYAEGGLSFFLLASLLAVVIALEQRGLGAARWPMVAIAGFLAGSAMACKYTGLVQVVLPLGAAVLLWAWLGRIHHRTAFHAARADAADSPARSTGIPPQETARATAQQPTSGSLRTLRPILAFAAGVAIAVGPWLVKNIVQTGNPVYPLAYSIFGGRDWDAELDARFRAGHSSSSGDFTAAHLAGGLLDVTARNDWHSALLYAFAPLALLGRRNRKLALGCWLYVLYLFCAWWLLTHRIDRFWVPMLPVVALLAGAGAAWCGNLIWKIIGGTVITAGVAFNLAFISTTLAGNNTWLGDVERLRPQAELTAPTIAFLNDTYDAGQLPANTKILLVGDAQVFDARFPHVYNTVFDHSIFEQWFGERDPEAPGGWRLAEAAGIRRRLDAAGITHVVVNWQELLRYRTTYGYTSFVTPGRFAELVEQGVLGPPETLRISSARGEELADSVRRQVEEWAPELKVPTPDGWRYVAAQVFPVASEK